MSTDDIHILPVNDLRDHDETRRCWCGPAIDHGDDGDDIVIVIHHSLDGRELVEEHGVN